MFVNGILSPFFLCVCVLQVQPPQWVGGTFLPHAVCRVLCFGLSRVQQLLLLEGASARTGPGCTTVDTHTPSHLPKATLNKHIYCLCSFCPQRQLKGFFSQHAWIFPLIDLPTAVPVYETLNKLELKEATVPSHKDRAKLSHNMQGLHISKTTVQNIMQ